MTRIKRSSPHINWDQGMSKKPEVSGKDIFIRGLKYHPDNTDPEDDWGPEAKELWNSKEFITKRLMEQESYVKEVKEKHKRKEISLNRKIELLSAAYIIIERLQMRLKYLTPGLP